MHGNCSAKWDVCTPICIPVCMGIISSSLLFTLLRMNRLYSSLIHFLFELLPVTGHTVSTYGPTPCSLLKHTTQCVLVPFLLIKYAGFPISDLLAATSATRLMNRIKFSDMPDCKCSFPDCSASAELEIALSANTPASKLFAKMFVGDKHKDECKSGQMCSKFQTFFFFIFSQYLSSCLIFLRTT